MILIKKSRCVSDISRVTVKEIVQFLLRELGYQDFDIGIWFTTDNIIARFNKTYRGKSGPTDILSFPYHKNLKVGQEIDVVDADDQNLGDLLISPEYVRQSVKWQEIKEQQRLPILLVHGICHLIGYDHETDQDYEAMHEKESILLVLLEQQKLFS